MSTSNPVALLEIDYGALDDPALVALARQGQRGAFRQMMQRCNQRLFRVARGVVNNDAEAEDVVQEAYVHAFEKLATFRGDSTLLTWMTRIVLNEAYSRLRKRRPSVDIAILDTLPAASAQVVPFSSSFGNEDPAACTARSEIRRLVERAIDDLPEPFRLVFVMREIEECSVEETARSLDIRAETVKTRLYRARRMLRASLNETLSATLADAFPFLGQRCARITEAVLDRLGPVLDAQRTCASMSRNLTPHPGASTNPTGDGT
jgi:RNA polymerase sigma factor (sigma-70 family)